MGGLSKVHMPSSAVMAGQSSAEASSAAEACRARSINFTGGILFSEGMKPWRAAVESIYESGRRSVCGRLAVVPTRLEAANAARRCG